MSSSFFGPELLCLQSAAGERSAYGDDRRRNSFSCPPLEAPVHAQVRPGSVPTLVGGYRWHGRPTDAHLDVWGIGGWCHQAHQAR